MAILNTPLPDYVRGSVEGIVVIKHWLGKTVITAFPDMSRIVFSPKQKAEQRRFADAVAYAKGIISDPQRKALYQARLPKGKKVFNAAIADYMKGRMSKEEVSSGSVQVQLSYAQTAFLLNKNRSRTESVLKKEKTSSPRPVFTLNSGPGEVYYPQGIP